MSNRIVAYGLNGLIASGGQGRPSALHVGVGGLGREVMAARAPFRLADPRRMTLRQLAAETTEPAQDPQVGHDEQAERRGSNNAPQDNTCSNRSQNQHRDGSYDPDTTLRPTVIGVGNGVRTDRQGESRACHSDSDE